MQLQARTWAFSGAKILQVLEHYFPENSLPKELPFSMLFLAAAGPEKYPSGA
ncbi:MAG: hypothetical protein AB9861_12430 [Methanosarcina sp.]